MDELAEGRLRLGDGHAHRDADVDVRFVAGRAFDVQNLASPKLDVLGLEHFFTEQHFHISIVESVQEQGSLYGILHLFGVVDVYGGLEGETLWVYRLLRTMVALEVEVVRRTERQLLLQALYLLAELLVGIGLLDGLHLDEEVILVLALLLLHHEHLLLLLGEVTNLPHELGEPRLLGQLGVVVEEAG